MVVPLAGLLASQPGAPDRRCHSFIKSAGKPLGKVVNPFDRTMPIISQCPVVVSLPSDISDMRPNPAPAFSDGAHPGIPVMFPRPHFCRFGTTRPPTRFAQLPSVFAP